jgi:hypothetical protein
MDCLGSAGTCSGMAASFARRPGLAGAPFAIASWVTILMFASPIRYHCVASMHLALSQQPTRCGAALCAVQQTALRMKCITLRCMQRRRPAPGPAARFLFGTVVRIASDCAMNCMRLRLAGRDGAKQLGALHGRSSRRCHRCRRWRACIPPACGAAASHDEAAAGGDAGAAALRRSVCAAAGAARAGVQPVGTHPRSRCGSCSPSAEREGDLCCCVANCALPGVTAVSVGRICYGYMPVALSGHVAKPAQDAVSAALATALDSAVPSALATERGMIQLAVDIDVLAHVLAPPPGVPPAPQADPTASKAAAGSIGALHQRLVEGMDPIDWATYEPFLQQHVNESIDQKAVHLGMLLPMAPRLKVRTQHGGIRCTNGHVCCSHCIAGQHIWSSAPSDFTT